MNKPLDILKQYWGYDHFRPLQPEIIQAIADRYDVLALLPTGGGKSICFQVPALMHEGICIVITPLIALMKDQVYQLTQRGIKAVAIYSGMSSREIDVTLDNCIYGGYKFLYLSPERLQTEIFQERLSKMKVNFLVVDEAHCVSQWGYDFRPLYLKIAKVRELMREVNIVALTATATSEVKLDIVDKLMMQHHKAFQASFARKNLSYAVRHTEDKYAKTLEILKAVPGSAILYVRTRKSSKEVSEALRGFNISCDYYHGGLSNDVRSYKQDSWIRGSVRVMVATNAFGMGIDKPDVRLVLHLDLPETLEAYYQEAGRAGRDGKKSYAVILSYPNDDKDLLHRVESTHPSVGEIKRVYQSLANYYKLAVGSGEGVSFEFDINEFCAIYKLDNLMVYRSIKKAEEQGLIQMNEGFYSPSKLMFNVDNKALYEFMIANAQYEPLIKGILRIYGGELFGAYLNMSEQKIVQHTHMTLLEVRRMLRILHEHQILSYEPVKDGPQVVFTIPRQHEKNIPLDEVFLRERKELSVSKAHAVAAYSKNCSQCRTQLLLEYFGEKKEKRCGICDFCISDRNKYDENESFVKLRSMILKELAESPVDIDQLVSSIAGPHIKPANIIEAVRLMLDFDDIAYDSYGNLTIGSKK